MAVVKFLVLCVFVAILSEVKAAGWTSWLNRDGPGGTGDYETVADFNPHPCGGNTPTQIEVRVGSGAAQKVQVGAALGLACKNADQPGSTYCHDYQVRFNCP